MIKYVPPYPNSPHFYDRIELKNKWDNILYPLHCQSGLTKKKFHAKKDDLWLIWYSTSWGGDISRFFYQSFNFFYYGGSITVHLVHMFIFLCISGQSKKKTCHVSLFIDIPAPSHFYWSKYIKVKTSLLKNSKIG